MAIENKRMQQRYGTYEEFERYKSTLLPNEFAAVNSGCPDTADGAALYFKNGSKSAKRMLSEDDVGLLSGGIDPEWEQLYNDKISKLSEEISELRNRLTELSQTTAGAGKTVYDFLANGATSMYDISVSVSQTYGTHSVDFNFGEISIPNNAKSITAYLDYGEMAYGGMFKLNRPMRSPTDENITLWGDFADLPSGETKSLGDYTIADNTGFDLSKINVHVNLTIVSGDLRTAVLNATTDDDRKNLIKYLTEAKLVIEV